VTQPAATPPRLSAVQHPETIDSRPFTTAFRQRPVLRAYGYAAFAAGLAIMAIPWPQPVSFATAHVDRLQAWRAVQLVMGTTVWCFGMLGAQLANIEDPAARRSALRTLAFVWLFIGTLYFAPAWPIFQDFLPPWIAVPPIACSLVLFYFSFGPRRRRIVAHDPGTVVFHDKLSPMGRFAASIRQAARQEERARLARDLHDAVKQQLFVIQTAAATVEQRFEADRAGAQAALAQVRASARDALAEMEVMLEQLQAVPIGNAGLVASLKQQCEVLAFRTGADVRFTPGHCRPTWRFRPAHTRRCCALRRRRWPTSHATRARRTSLWPCSGAISSSRCR